MTDREHDVTRLLEEFGADKKGAADQLLPLIYGELKRLASVHMAGERAGHTLSPTALVHEAWLKLTKGAHRDFDSRSHFFAVAAEAMRRLLVDHARGRSRQRRGGGRRRVDLEQADLAANENPEEFLALEQVIRRLEEMDPRMGRVVQLRYFAGLSIEETAAAMSVSPRSVKREWTCARAWLFRELSDSRNDGGDSRGSE